VASVAGAGGSAATTSGAPLPIFFCEVRSIRQSPFQIRQRLPCDKNYGCDGPHARRHANRSTDFVDESERGKLRAPRGSRARIQMLVPPVVSKTGRTTRQPLRRKYCADWRILLSMALALVLVAGVIFGVRLAPPARAVRSDARPVESIVAPASDRNNDDYVELLRRIVESTEP
jgi:hypothetical protein